MYSSNGGNGGLLLLVVTREVKFSNWKLEVVSFGSFVGADNYNTAAADYFFAAALVKKHFLILLTFAFHFTLLLLLNSNLLRLLQTTSDFPCSPSFFPFVCFFCCSFFGICQKLSLLLLLLPRRSASSQSFVKSQLCQNKVECLCCPAAAKVSSQPASQPA